MVEMPHHAGSMPAREPAPFVARRIWRARGRAADRYDAADALGREVGQRMLERLDLMRLPDGAVADVGCATGSATRLLQKRYPERLILGVDPSIGLLAASQPGAGPVSRMRAWFGSGRVRRVGADPVRLPLRPGSVALVWSNLLLQAIDDPEGAMRSWMSALVPGGLLMFSTLGPDTLRELRRAFAAVDALPHVHDFVDMHNIGDSLVAAGFADPVMDMELITLTYPTVAALAADLRGLGQSNAAAGRGRGFFPPARWRAMVDCYERARVDGRLPATFEVIQGHAWKPAEGPRRTADGLDIVRLHRRPG